MPFNINDWSFQNGFRLKLHSFWCGDHKTAWPRRGHPSGVRWQVFSLCPEEAVVVRGGTTVSPLRSLAENWRPKRETDRGEVTMDARGPGKFWGDAAANERKPILSGTFSHFRETQQYLKYAV